MTSWFVRKNCKYNDALVEFVILAYLKYFNELVFKLTAQIVVKLVAKIEKIDVGDYKDMIISHSPYFKCV